jgi:hypothetical protein
VTLRSIDLALLVLASFRLTHLVVFDKIAEPIRTLVPPGRRLSYLLHCYWCAGVWLSAGLIALLCWWPGPGHWVMIILAVAGGQSALETILRVLEKGVSAR